MKTQTQKTDFAMKLQRQLYALVRQYEQCDRECLSQHGVTASQSYTLLSLPASGSLSMNELSEAMGLAGSTMTRIVDQLVDKGLADREVDSEDRRVVRVALTARGKKIRDKLNEELEAFFNMALANIGEKDQPAILGALDRVTQAMKISLTKCCGR